MSAAAGTAALAIDVGMTAVKAAVVTRDGRLVSLARTFWTTPWTVGDEAAPPVVPDIWPTVCRAVRDCLDSARDAHRIAVVVPTVAAQTGVAVDRAGCFFTLPAPPPVPPDAAEPDVDAPWGDEGWSRFGYGAILLRCARRARRLQPELARRIHRIGPMHAYLIWRLTGRWATDPASGPGGHSWPEAAVAWSGLTHAALPELLEGDELVGPLTAAAAAGLALAPAPVATGGHDGACASFGAGCYRVGDCAISLSTNFVPRPVHGARVAGLFGYPVRPGAWAWVQGLASAGRQIDVARNVIAAAAPGWSGETDLDEAALGARARAAPLPTLPYLPRGRVAEQAARVRKAMSDGCEPERVYLAVVSGCVQAVAQRVREGAHHGIAARRFVVTGGMTRRRVVVAELERALGQPIAVAHPECGLLGAAALGSCAVGWQASPEAALAVVSSATGGALPVSGTRTERDAR